MLKPLIRTLNGWRFERPLALVLGAAVAFAMIAMPWSPFAGIPAVAAHGLERPLDWALAAVAAIFAGVAAFRAMKYPWSARAAEPVDERETESDAPAMDVSLRLRRSDAHPDFPPREPIRASRDLGEPFMDIVGFDDGADAPVGGAHRRIFDGEYVELAATAPEQVEQPVGRAAPAVALSAPEAEPPTPLPGIDASMPSVALAPVEDSEEHPSIAAFTPEPVIEPAPQPERARRESLAEMMERLSAGLERRAGRPVAAPPADMLAEVLARPRAATPELREALDELNRLAGRRG